MTLCQKNEKYLEMDIKKSYEVIKTYKYYHTWAFKILYKPQAHFATDLSVEINAMHLKLFYK